MKAVEQFGAREKLALQLLRFGIPLGVVLFPLLVLFLAVYALKRYRRSRPEV